jgi:hypothetical protein
MSKKTDALGAITVIDAQIKDLTKQRDAMRVEAVTHGYAVWDVTIRMSAPSLAWWRENRPTVWKKYAKPSTIRRFVPA